LLLMAGCAPGASAAAPGSLKARPGSATAKLPSGVTELAHGAFVYRPASAGEGPLPLIVMLHGAGGRAEPFLETFRQQADREQILLLSLQSARMTWDMIADMSEQRRSGRRSELRFGEDVRRIDAVLGELFSRAEVDPKRVALAGFSDGASYALSLGMANPDLFAGVIALSPGFFHPPPTVRREQRLFIAHGRRDQVLPFANAERIAAMLEQARVKLRFQPFDGPHVISRQALEDGIAFTLGVSSD
jgi:predicted esterase